MSDREMGCGEGWMRDVLALCEALERVQVALDKSVRFAACYLHSPEAHVKREV